MNIKTDGSYRSPKGNVVFRYTVNGTPAELEAYKKAQGEFYREQDITKKPLFFTTRSAGNSANLIITQKGKVIVDMSKFDAAASLVAQYGGNLGAELAKAAVADLLSGSNSSTPVAAPAVIEQETNDLQTS